MLKLLLAASACLVASGHYPGHGGHPGTKRCAIKAVAHLYHCDLNGSEQQPRVSHLECHSGGGKYLCLIPGNWLGNVTAIELAREGSENKCVEGKTYGFMEEKGVWVTEGCSAAFSYVLKTDPALCEKTKQQLMEMGCGDALKSASICKADIEKNCVCPHHKRCTQEVQEVEEDEETSEHGHHGMHRRHNQEGSRFSGPFQGFYRRKGHQMAMCLKRHWANVSDACQAEVDKYIPHTHLHMMYKSVPHPTYGHHHAWYMDTQMWKLTGIVMAGALIYFCLLRAQHKEQRIRREQIYGPRQYLGQWSTGLFHFDVASCLPSCLFPCCQSALNQAEVHGRDASCADVFLNVHSTQALANNIYSTRQAIKHKYSIAPTETLDCLTACLCGPCAMAQHTREMEIRSQGQMRAVHGTVKEVEGVALMQSAVPVQAKMASDSM